MFLVGTGVFAIWRIFSLRSKGFKRNTPLKECLQLARSRCSFREEIFSDIFGEGRTQMPKIVEEGLVIEEQAFLERREDSRGIAELHKYFFHFLDRHFEFGCVRLVDPILAADVRTQCTFVGVKGLVY